MYHVRTTTVINAPISRVWAAVRDFNALPEWHPAIAASVIERDQPSDQVGCIRRFTLLDGAVIRERLLALDDHSHRCTYCILTAPMAWSNYVATLRFEPVSDGDRTFAEWSAQFDCEQSAAAELIDLVSNAVFREGLRALDKKIGR